MSGKTVISGRIGGLSRLLAECGAQGNFFEHRRRYFACETAMFYVNGGKKQCGQAAVYGKCVSAGASELRRGACATEFEELKQCITKAAKKRVK